MDDLVRKCIHLLVSNRSMNNILTILLDYVVQQTGNTHGFIGERKQKDGSVFYRYHAISLPMGSDTSNGPYWKDYLTNGYFDLGSEHAMHKDINIGEIHINNAPKLLPHNHPPIDKIICLPLHDAENGVIGVVGLSGGTSFTKETAATYQPYIEICSYILQLAIERANINHHKNNFLLSVSNALREPIDGILGVSKLSTAASLTPVQRQYIDAVTFYSIKLLDMVNDIQDYTKMVSGNLHLINKTMSLQQCLDTVMLITQQKLEGPASVSLNLTCSPDLPDTIIADEMRLTQILVNLLDNACKFTKKGTVHLHITTDGSASKAQVQASQQAPQASQQAPQASQQLEFTITDTGIGMSAEQVHNVFTNTPKEGKGMGLGLLIVKYLVDMFGGNITIRSTPNVGTVVQFTLFVGRKIELTHDQIKQTFDKSLCLLYSEVRNQPLVDILGSYGIQTVQLTSLKEFKKRFKSVKINPFKLLIFGKSTEDDKNHIIKYLTAGSTGTEVSGWCRVISTEKPITRNEDTYYLAASQTEAVADVLTAIITNVKENDISIDAVAAMTKGSVLIAEDNTECRDILVDFIKKIGYQDIDTVSDGLELYLKLTSDKEYDMVFVSLTIGVLDGLTAVKKYRERTSPGGVGTLIIAVTGSISAGLKDSCYASGMNGYILKPIRMQDIAKLDKMRMRRSYDLIKATG